MDLGLKGKIALITGGAGGIGRAEAAALAQEGAAIAVNDLDAQAAESCADDLRAKGFAAITAIGDVSEPDGAARVVRLAAEQLGGLDILINNAGAGGRHLGRSVEDMDVDDWDVIVRTHLRSTFLCSKYAVPLMRDRGFGRIVNTSSMNVTGGGRPGVANYSAAKAGVLGFTRTFAKEVGGCGVTVNAIAPGYVETNLIAGFSEQQRAVITGQNPLGRFCQPEEVGAVIAFLCSKQASFINGALICMDGGKRDFHWGDA
ncbi:3-oxoacyl-[acyl-carrier protein] reductase [Ancylobacter aquaticus]|uniref:3-oxoacyl-[acyl-carrier protein] reductase n=1 Tax=Ancylobacter aquaticus TaxID=100 RepID=A0A4R1I0L2_ANCAQ|nr:SDR family NAD(P)-dependent oxidoreductase [Ancylobacter aquaticus]TCK23432.1 3-oxoacyl-[acyl-carrier protein] reductase [Ancylobacter aquaticus]